jgi:hypothetical protein
MLTLLAKFQYPWSWKKVGLLWVASVVPFGTFYADYKILRFQERRDQD